MKLVVLSTLFLQAILLFGQAGNKKPDPIPGIPMAMALSHRADGVRPALNPQDPPVNSEGMAAYRIIVTSDGTLERWERVAGVADVQRAADQIVSKWRFKPLTLKVSSSPTAWWSLVGICYAKDWGGLLLCAPAAGGVSDPKLRVSPQRIFIDRKVEADAELDLAPLEKIQGAKFKLPMRAQLARLQGDTIIDLIIATDGSVSSTAVSGHPMLMDDTLSTVKTWRFAPPMFLGNPVEVQLRLIVEYIDSRG